MLCCAAISLMVGPAGSAVAWAAGADTVLATVAMTSPTAAIAAVTTFRGFNASDSLRSAFGLARQAYRPPVRDGANCELNSCPVMPRMALTAMAAPDVRARINGSAATTRGRSAMG